MSAPDVFGYGIVSPVKGRLIAAGTHLFSRKAAMRQAVKLCTVHGGSEPGETWRALYRKGYRIVRVRVAVAFACVDASVSIKAPRS